MRESHFIDLNREKWHEFEKILQTSHYDPDKISTLFVQITDDLAYARTFYPNRTVRFYLNFLSQKVFGKIYRNRVLHWKSFWRFWSDELPWVLWNARKQLLLALCIFTLSMLLGGLITAYNPQFTRLMLGDYYVEMTIQNIEKGDPMAVYKQSEASWMFLSITFNNIRVAFMVFIFGVLLGVGSIYLLIFNALMLGTFQYFFLERGVMTEAMITVWQHGTLEIASIIIAGAAGIVLGRGFVFPGSYTRLDAFRLSAQRGIRILLGTVPLFVMAGFIEGFVTRHTQAPMALRILVILASVSFIVFYFVWLPWKKHRTRSFRNYPPDRVPSSSEFRLKEGIQSNSELIKDGFTFLKQHFAAFMKIAGLAVVVILGLFFVLYPGNSISYVTRFVTGNFSFSTPFNYLGDLFNLFDPLTFPVVATAMVLMVSMMLHTVMTLLSRYTGKSNRSGTGKFLLTLSTVLMAHVPFLTHEIPGITILLCLLSAPLFFFRICCIYQCNRGTGTFREALVFTRIFYLRALIFLLTTTFISLLMMLVFATPVMYLYIEFILQHFPDGSLTGPMFYMGYLVITGITGLFLLFPFVMSAFAMKKRSLDEIRGADSLIRWFERMGNERRAYGLPAE